MTMTVTRPTSNLKVKTLTVGQSEVNEQGILTNCTMLQEVTSINDNAMIAAFGKLNFEGISVSRYNLDFHGEAMLGDQLKIESTYSVSGSTSLTILIAIRKGYGAKSKAVLTGSFTFIDNSQKQ